MPKAGQDSLIRAFDNAWLCCSYMDERVRPLTIQELVDLCMGFLDGYSDLTACALVSRAWVDAAQANLFRTIHINWSHSANEKRWSQLRQVLDGSPRLIRYIHRLDIHSARLSDDTFSALSQFPFTHIDNISVSHFRDLEMSDCLAFQRLFSLPTLRGVHLECDIRHLHLQALQRVYEAFVAEPHPPFVRIPLDSLRIEYYDECLSDWLAHDICPFDLTNIKVLSIHTNMNLLCAPVLLPAFGTIEALDFQLVDFVRISSSSKLTTPIPSKEAETLHLSSLPNLTLVRVVCFSPNPLPIILPVLSTITATARIRTIILATTVPHSDLAALDVALSSLPIPRAPIIELEIHAAPYALAALRLTRLSARNMLRRGDYDPRWFDLIVDLHRHDVMNDDLLPGVAVNHRSVLLRLC
ncbi:hypothetical protein DFH09DRAFT_1314703 [Mycena vulgaris]|nr:hypothetical protein DFH09DRAFT_1314703 [Mycena vulgaris]